MCGGWWVMAIVVEDACQPLEGVMFQERIQNTEAVECFIQEVLGVRAEVKIWDSDWVQSLKRKHSLLHYKNSTLLKYARAHYPEHETELENALRISRGRSHSGVLVITIFTSPYPEYVDAQGVRKKQAFSCKWNCAYCPNEPNQPRSYLLKEPGVLRANTHRFDCVNQMWARMEALYNTGHPVDKLEVLVLGGTWESYPLEYRNEFIRDMYYAANTFWDEEKRVKASLALERDGNQNAACKVIGLTLETRPDTICLDSIRIMRNYGCTRVQLGIQHLDDTILEKVNRQCPTAVTVSAIQLLKRNGFKIDAHWMPNLPGASEAIDMDMFLGKLLNESKPPEDIDPLVPGIHQWTRWHLTHPELQVDQWKIYPCEIVPYTEIEKWWRAGEYVIYDVTELLLQVKKHVFPWIRLNRIVRDIPSEYIFASGDQPNLRQELLCKMRKRGWECRCIRCREIKSQKMPSELYYRVQEYGEELFMSVEDESGKILCGFLRLRLEAGYPAFIRELHVYGLLAPTVHKNNNLTVQNKHLGSRLVELAEAIAIGDGYKRMEVIAGEGTRQYYKRLGYSDDESFEAMGRMVKVLVS
jgi:histone acetyltransferase (RNA polymerase elongator complex component)